MCKVERLDKYIMLTFQVSLLHVDFVTPRPMIAQLDFISLAYLLFVLYMKFKVLYH